MSGLYGAAPAGTEAGAVFGTAPAGAVRYAKIDEPECRAEFIAWGPLPTGNALCASITGLREDDLVRAILDGEFDGILRPRSDGLPDGEEREAG